MYLGQMGKNKKRHYYVPEFYLEATNNTKNEPFKGPKAFILR